MLHGSCDVGSQMEITRVLSGGAQKVSRTMLGEWVRGEPFGGRDRIPVCLQFYPSHQAPTLSFHFFPRFGSSFMLWWPHQSSQMQCLFLGKTTMLDLGDKAILTKCVLLDRYALC